MTGTRPLWHAHTPNPVVQDSASRDWNPASITDTTFIGIGDLTVNPTLVDTVRYDIKVWGMAIVKAPSGGSIRVGVEIDGTQFTAMESEAAEIFPIMFSGNRTSLQGSGGTITIRCLIRVTSGTGTLYAAHMTYQCIPRV
jgi:hypothetical protein